MVVGGVRGWSTVNLVLSDHLRTAHHGMVQWSVNWWDKTIETTRRRDMEPFHPKSQASSWESGFGQRIYRADCVCLIFASGILRGRSEIWCSVIAASSGDGEVRRVLQDIASEGEGELHQRKILSDSTTSMTIK